MIPLKIFHNTLGRRKTNMHLQVMLRKKSLVQTLSLSYFRVVALERFYSTPPLTAGYILPVYHSLFAKITDRLIPARVMKIFTS